MSTAPSPLLGIHHITAIASDPQANVDFYAGLLGLRLVKKTVNFDDPGTYHLYYGDELGRPGSILTFFPWPGARRGSRGSGQATATAFSIPAGALDFWRQRLSAAGVLVIDAVRRFDREDAIAFLDPDGLLLELVAHHETDQRAPWSGSDVPIDHAIRGFHTVTLAESALDPTAALLAAMGLRAVAEERAGEATRIRYDLGPGGPGAHVDVVVTPGVGRGLVAAGSVHHVAWRTTDDTHELAWRAHLAAAGHHLTEQLDRQYFKSVYFREPGGVLFELATDPPGFTRDEAPADLGTSLKLPPWLEDHRTRITAELPTLTVPGVAA